MQLVFYLPVPTHNVGELLRAGVPRGQGGDGVDGLGGPSVAGERAPAPADLDGLGGVREQQPDADGGEFQLAGLDAAVAPVAGEVADGDVAPRQGGELGVQLRLACV